MTTQELIDYYAGLLILQYVGQPKAFATIQILVTGVIMDQLPVQVEDAFDLTGDTIAVGVQLDVLGKYAGVTRSGNGFTGPITLNDADFYSLIQMAIIQNNAGSSLSDIQNLIFQFFPGQVLVFDYKDMTMSYMITSSVGSQNLIQLFITENILPRPMAVNIPLIIYAPVIDMFFGFRTYALPAEKNTPFNNYIGYHMDWPWLNYSDAIII